MSKSSKTLRNAAKHYGMPIDFKMPANRSLPPYKIETLKPFIPPRLYGFQFKVMNPRSDPTMDYYISGRDSAIPEYYLNSRQFGLKNISSVYVYGVFDTMFFKGGRLSDFGTIKPEYVGTSYTSYIGYLMEAMGNPSHDIKISTVALLLDHLYVENDTSDIGRLIYKVRDVTKVSGRAWYFTDVDYATPNGPFETYEAASVALGAFMVAKEQA